LATDLQQILRNSNAVYTHANARTKLQQHGLHLVAALLCFLVHMKKTFSEIKAKFSVSGHSFSDNVRLKNI
jgi:hypothetical protein